MKSPFPGMDPYIEAAGLWEDFHHDLITEIKGAISAALPERYVVLAGERSYVVLSSHSVEQEFLTNPDVGVAQLSGTACSSSGLEGANEGTAVLDTLAAEAGPVTMRPLIEAEYRESFVEIREVHSERKLVTCIETLSPSNKRPETPGWYQYLRKRQAFLQGAANFVEIDLLRGGRRMPMEGDWPESPYYLLVSRKQEALRCKVWRAHYLRPLPPIPIPLLPPDPDITLMLQPLVEAVYTRSHYDRVIDYRQPPTPPWSPAEASWLQERLREQRASD